MSSPESQTAAFFIGEHNKVVAVVDSLNLKSFSTYSVPVPIFMSVTERITHSQIYFAFPLALTQV